MTQINLILYSRTIQHDYRWISIPQDVKSHEKEALYRLFNSFFEVRSFVRDSFLPCFVINFEKYFVICCHRKTEDIDCVGRPIYALEGIALDYSWYFSRDLLTTYMLTHIESIDIYNAIVKNQKNPRYEDCVTGFLNIENILYSNRQLITNTKIDRNNSTENDPMIISRLHIDSPTNHVLGSSSMSMRSGLIFFDLANYLCLLHCKNFNVGRLSQLIPTSNALLVSSVEVSRWDFINANTCLANSIIIGDNKGQQIAE